MKRSKIQAWGFLVLSPMSALGVTSCTKAKDTPSSEGAEARSQEVAEVSAPAATAAPAPPKEDQAPNEPRPPAANPVAEKFKATVPRELSLMDTTRRGDDEVSQGSLLFATWARHHMTQEDLMAIESADFGPSPLNLAGRRICVRGEVLRAGVREPDLTWGILKVGPGNSDHVLFFDAKAGRPKNGDELPFCGVVTEGYRFKNERGYNRYGLIAVGMAAASEAELSADARTHKLALSPGERPGFTRFSNPCMSIEFPDRFQQKDQGNGVVDARGGVAVFRCDRTDETVAARAGEVLQVFSEPTLKVVNPTDFNLSGYLREGEGIYYVFGKKEGDTLAQVSILYDTAHRKTYDPHLGAIKRSLRIGGAPEGQPTSAPLGAGPTNADWATVREVTVQGSSALKCETKVLDGHFRAVCSENGGGKPKSVSFTGKSAPGSISHLDGDKLVLIHPYSSGTEFKALFAWEYMSSRLHVAWPAGAPRPQMVGIFDGGVP